MAAVSSLVSSALLVSCRLRTRHGHPRSKMESGDRGNACSIPGLACPQHSLILRVDRYAAIGNAHGFPGTMPILEHGEVNLFQHNAIESYLASIAPKFKDLTPAQKATDLMFALTKADINSQAESLLFQKITKEDLVPMMDKTLPMIEGLLPDSGFINGLSFPTVADLAVMVVAQGCMPFQAAMTMAGCPIWDGAKYPKMGRIAKETMSYPPVAAFLAKSEHKTLKADPFGIMPPEYSA